MSDQRIGTCTVCLTAPSLPHRPRRAVPAPYGDGMAAAWPSTTPGLLTLPSGRAVRGRAWTDVADPRPDLGLYLLPRPPAALPWESRWVRWRDFALPSDAATFRESLVELLDRAGAERTEIACRGGTGRTGTALACLAVLDGVAPDEAVAFVRAGYRPQAVETKAQAGFVAAFR